MKRPFQLLLVSGVIGAVALVTVLVTGKTERSVQSTDVPSEPASQVQPNIEEESSSGPTESPNTLAKAVGASVSDSGTRTIPVRDRPPEQNDVVSALFQEETIEFYPKMAALVESGNAIAAFHLYHFLNYCYRLPKDDASFEQAVTRMYETRLAPGITEGNAPNPAFNPEAVEASVRRTYAQCRGVPAEALTTRDLLLAQSAELGNPSALGDFISQNMQADPIEAARLAEKYWQAGGVNGATFLAQMYATGWEGQPPDLVSAAAYGYISTQLMIEHFQNLEGITNPELVATVIQELQAEQTGYFHAIGSGEHAEARALAERLIAENDECCFL